AAEKPGVRFLRLLADAFPEGAGYVAAVGPKGRLAPPANADRWGWRFESGDWRARSACVGYLFGDCPGEVGVILRVALRVAMALADKSKHPLALTEQSLGTELDRCELLSRQGKDAATVQRRVGERGRYLFVQARDLGIDLDSTPGDGSEDPPEDTRE